MTIQGLGASVSPAISGWIAQLFGFHTAFLILGSFSLVSAGLWVGFAGLLRSACRSVRAAGTATTPA